MEYGNGIFQNIDGSYPFERTKLACEDSLVLRVGLPQWGVSEWKGDLYPKDCPTKNFLKEYARRLECVEVSSTFYANVADSTLKNWCEVVSEKFKFLPKWPQNFTHERRLQVSKEEIQGFVNKMKTLGENLGTTILQLPPNFSTQQKKDLFYFLQDVPEGFPLSVEFRHESWFEDSRVYPQLENYLINRDIGMVVSDTPALRNVFHLSFTGSKNVIRYLSDRVEETDRQRLNMWKTWFKSQKRGGEMYFALHTSEMGGSSTLLPLWDAEKWAQIQEMNQGPQQFLFE